MQEIRNVCVARGKAADVDDQRRLGTGTRGIDFARRESRDFASRGQRGHQDLRNAGDEPGQRLARHDLDGLRFLHALGFPIESIMVDGFEMLEMPAARGADFPMNASSASRPCLPIRAAWQRVVTRLILP